jgi:sporulation and spore germination protein/immunoglobulin-like protein involved in spore germination
MTERHDATEELLRRALESSAAGIEVDPAALAKIRARTSNHAWWHRIRGGAMPLAFTSAAATAVAATLASVFLTMGSCTPPSGEVPGASPTAQPPVSESPPPSPAGQSAGPSGQTPGTSQTASVPVYYLNDYRTKPMLYREYHRLNVGDGTKAARTRAAVTEMLDGRTALDNDYFSTWPASAKVRNVTVDGQIVTVDLSGAAVNGYDPPSETAALQQLIWTATAASDTDGVKLLLDGKPVAKLWNLLNTGGTLRRAPYVDVVAPVWVMDPQEGAVVGKDGVTINVAGIVWEATMRVRVRDSKNKIVFDHTFTLTAGPPDQGTGSVRTPALAPGKYKVEGFFISANDSSIQAMDDHTFTVR